MRARRSRELDPHYGYVKYAPLESHDCSLNEIEKPGVPSFGLTREIYAPIILVIYLFGGATLYKFMEGWIFLDALYFCTISLETVGYGNIVPSTSVMKIFTVFYIYVGIAFITGTVGTVLGRTVSEFAIPKVTYNGAAGMISHHKPFIKYNQLGLLRSLFIIVCVSTLGTVFFAINEHMSIVNAFYFTMITLSTVGYGDVDVQKTSSKIFNIFLVIIGIALIGMAIFKFADAFARLEEQRWITKFVKRGVRYEVIQAIDKDKSGKIERHEFLAYMLVYLGRVQASDIDQINQLYNELDRDINGALDLRDRKIDINKFSINIV